MTRLRADLLLLLAAFIWGTAFIAQKYANDRMGALQFVGGRFLLSALLLAPLAYRESRRATTRSTAHDFGLASLIGLCLFGALTAQQIGLAATTVTNAGFITSLYIAFVPFVAWFANRTPLRPIIVAAIVVSLVGAWLLANHGQAQHLTSGDLLVLGAAIITAFHITLVATFLKRTHRPFFLSLVQYVVCTVCGILAGAVFEPIDWQGIAATMPAMLYAGALSGAVGFTLQIIAQRHTPAAEAALIMSLESVFAALAAAIVLGERLSFLALVGCGLILFGVIMIEVAPAWARRRPAPLSAETTSMNEQPSRKVEECV